MRMLKVILMITLVLTPLSGIADGTSNVSPKEAGKPGRFFDARKCLENSVEQNKVAAIPAIRKSRGPKKTVTRIGDVIEFSEEHLLKENLDCCCNDGIQWASNLHKKKLKYRGKSYTWNNISIQPGLNGAKNLKWGTREYNCPDRTFLNCDFTEIPKEHGFYVSSYGNTRIENCTFLRIGSQGSQWAHRSKPYQQYGPDNMPYPSRPKHLVRNSHFVDCAYRGDRPSFNLTYFSPGSSAMPGTILIEDSSFVCKWPTQRGDGAWSTGALVITPGQGGPEITSTVGQMMESVTLRNVLFDFTGGDRPLVEIRSATEIVIEDCCFIARDHRQPWVLIDRDWSGYNLGGTKTQRVILSNTVSRGAKLNVLLTAGKNGKQKSVRLDLNCPGEEITYSGVTGKEIRRRSIK